MPKKIEKKKADKSKKPVAKLAKSVKKAAPPKVAKATSAKKVVAKPTKKPAPAVVAKKPAPSKVAVAAKSVKKAAATPVKKIVHEKPPAKVAPVAKKPAAKVAKAPPEEEEVLVAVVEEEILETEGEEVEESDEVVLTDAEGRRYCRVKDCDQLASVDGYCRYHYLLYWKKIQVRKKILTEGKLERYVEELTARYPDKFLDMLRKDLRSDKEFLAAIAELEIDESATENELEDEAQNYIDEVRGMGEATSRDDEDF